MYHGRELITLHGHTVADHGQTWSVIKNCGTMVKLLPGLILE